MRTKVYSSLVGILQLEDGQYGGKGSEFLQCSNENMSRFIATLKEDT